MSRSIASTFVLLVLVLTPPTARAECIFLTAKRAMASTAIELVFSGRVAAFTRTAENGYRATFDVERVWKGSVPKRFEVYVWELAGEMPQFTLERHIVALAQRLTDPRVRAGAGLAGTDTVAFTPTACSHALTPTFERDLGRGYPPTSDGAAAAQPPRPGVVSRRAGDCGEPRSDIDEQVQSRIETELSQTPRRGN
jgi:hypothetical protein